MKNQPERVAVLVKKYTQGTGRYGKSGALYSEIYAITGEIYYLDYHYPLADLSDLVVLERTTQHPAEWGKHWRKTNTRYDYLWRVVSEEEDESNVK